jgi:16S rRNA (uracil1498-N3)-methyltransferase
MPRIFVPQDQLPFITGSDVHYLKDVLRIKPGDEIEILDGIGTIYLAKINNIQKDKIKLDIIRSSQSETEPEVEITLAQSLPKAKKMDFIIQKCTELGVSEIIPVITERSISKGEKTARWQKIAIEAAEQSGRASIPKVASLIDFKSLLKKAKEFDLALIPWEMEKTNRLKTILQKSSFRNIIMLIGPEGGFSSQEIAEAKTAGFIPISLGKRILRAETAGMAMLSMMMYELDA